MNLVELARKGKAKDEEACRKNLETTYQRLRAEILKSLENQGSYHGSVYSFNEQEAAVRLQKELIRAGLCVDYDPLERKYGTFSVLLPEDYLEHMEFKKKFRIMVTRDDLVKRKNTVIQKLKEAHGLIEAGAISSWKKELIDLEAEIMELS